MQSVREIVKGEIVSPWRGSEQTATDVRRQIEARLGAEIAASFNAATDAMPLSSWASFGFRVKRGERSFRSITFREIEDEDGRVIRKIRKVVHLFHKSQVEKL